MKIKDLKAGEKAYLVEDGEIKAIEIEKVGRKYVYVKSAWYPYLLRDEADNYLVQDKDWGSRSFLFLNEQDAIDVVDRKRIIGEVRKKVDWFSCKLSADQLRRISAIINEVNDE